MPKSSYSPAELESMIQGWERIVVAGLNGSATLLVGCPICGCLLTRENAPVHLSSHGAR